MTPTGTSIKKREGCVSSGKSTESVEDVIEKVVKAAKDDRLLLFFGTGFSHAVLRYPARTLGKYRRPIPGWMDLLKAICEDKEITSGKFKDFPEKEGLPFDCPAIATEMAKEAENGSEAIKASAARQTVWLPNLRQHNDIGSILRNLNPAAIVTTNYDEVVEGLLGDDSCKSLARRDEVQVPMRGKIAVWHFHGSRNESKNIVLTREDYLEFFRPGNYAQAKLSQLLHDYFTLFVGYSLSDINLLAALDWAQNVYQTTNGFAGYARLDKLDRHVRSERGGEEPLRRLIVEFSEDCNTPVLGDSPAASCAVIRTNNVINILERISKDVRTEPANTPSPDNSSRPAGYNRQYVESLLTSGTGSEDVLEKLADDYSNASGKQSGIMERTRIIESIWEALRSILLMQESSGEKSATFSVNPLSFLMGILHVFHLQEMPVSFRVDFLGALESELGKLSRKRRRVLVSEEISRCAESDVMHENIDWLCQVSSYCNYRRCVKFAESVLGGDARR